MGGGGEEEGRRTALGTGGFHAHDCGLSISRVICVLTVRLSA